MNKLCFRPRSLWEAGVVTALAVLVSAGGLGLHLVLAPHTSAQRIAGPSRRTTPTGAPGSQWHRIGLAGMAVHSIALGHGQSRLLFAGTETGIYRTTSNRAWQRALRSDIVGSLLLLPDNRTVIAGDNAGDVFSSRDVGRHWHLAKLSASGVYALLVSPGEPRQPSSSLRREFGSPSGLAPLLHTHSRSLARFDSHHQWGIS